MGLPATTSPVKRLFESFPSGRIGYERLSFLSKHQVRPDWSSHATNKVLFHAVSMGRVSQRERAKIVTERGPTG